MRFRHQARLPPPHNPNHSNDNCQDIEPKQSSKQGDCNKPDQEPENRSFVYHGYQGKKESIGPERDTSGGKAVIKNITTEARIECRYSLNLNCLVSQGCFAPARTTYNHKSHRQRELAGSLYCPDLPLATVPIKAPDHAAYQKRPRWPRRRNARPRTSSSFRQSAPWNTFFCLYYGSIAEAIDNCMSGGLRYLFISFQLPLEDIRPSNPPLLLSQVWYI